MSSTLANGKGADRPGAIRAHPIRGAREKAIGLAASIAIPLIVWFAPIHMAVPAHHALAICSFMIVAWIASVIPHAMTGMLGCYLFWLLKVTSFEEAFSGFADQTPWFLFGAMLIGTMATTSGLARRIALSILRRVGSGYSNLLLGMILTSFVLAFLVPSGIACVVIMASVALGLMDVFKLGKGSNVGRGLFVTLTYTAGMFDKVVVAGAASILGRGLLEKATGVHLYWSLWVIAFLPVALIVIFATWRLAIWLFPPESEMVEASAAYLEEETSKLGPLTGIEKRAVVLMALASGLWATDLLHHISPAVIGIGVGLLTAVPFIGVLDADDLRSVNFLPILFTACAITMGNILVRTQALQTLAVALFGWMRHLVTNIYLVSFIPYWVAFLYHILLGNELSMLATSLPPLMNFAHTAGLPSLPLGLVWIFASGGKIFIYQSGPMVTGYAYGYFEQKDLVKIGICLSIVESLALLLVVPFYWPHIGIR